jgi:hypothetical protein
MRAGLRLLLLLLLAPACIGAPDVQNALDAYCKPGTNQCMAEADCCKGFTCANLVCHEVTPGECLPVDAGTRANGLPCGCSKDCASGTCTDSVCR